MQDDARCAFQKLDADPSTNAGKCRRNGSSVPRRSKRARKAIVPDAGPSEEVHDISVVRSSKAWLMTQEGRHKVDGMVAKLPRTLASKVNHYVETFS
ncbi:hypothetical protein HBH56_102530 [Parastagonospora nodorum]|nr:hypothetical protein HBH56_102530 [Parastagonospora nodorum]KAH3975477.1 hypothetical protein HBH52_124960 [Parastagonospora nodorum]KAH3978934.1 hypothetical protein HBH51_061910 [Parastagonospora nodorum]KAH3999040.1 hypothetical protein HBI10_118550 [Parastagonospora nodorum]KAH4049182.1 hypothetical protein HBH49_143370 [Parastagonospora nodorum]